MTSRPEHPDTELRELLPWYVNGTLAADERERLERTLATSPALAAEYDWLKKVQADLSARQNTQAKVESALAEFWRRQAVKQDNHAKTVLPDNVVALPLRQGFTSRQWSALAMAASVLLSTALGLGYWWGMHHGDAADGNWQLAGTQATGCTTEDVRLALQFDESLPEKSIRQILVATRARLCGMPSSLGTYTIGVEKDRASSVYEALKQNEAVIHVEQKSE